MTRMSHTGKAIGFAVSGAVAMALLAGCASAGSKQLARAGDHAVRSEAKQGRAVDAAENAVGRNPNDAAARLSLAQAYLDAGRFQSAAATFQDAVTLGDASGGTQLRLALAQIGAGDSRAAVELLNGASDTIAPSDRGLALALAGETGRGVAVLLDALRAGENSPKLRQNLAFAYALDGQWREARIAMAQDVPADRIDDRISEWAMMSRPEDVQRRVAALLSVPTGVADAGQPAALALGAAPQDKQLAAAEPAPAPVVQTAAAELPPVDATPVAPAPVAVAAAEPAPAVTSFAAAFGSAPPPAYVAQQPHAPVIAAPAAYRKAAAAAPRAAVAAPTIAASANGTHMVQLGSFSSEANARRAIQVYTARNPELRNLRMTITPAVVRGKNFWRVAAADLDGSTASQLCSGVKNRGGVCFAYAADHAPLGGKPMLAWSSASPARTLRR